MPSGDACRWNQRYREESRRSFQEPRRLLLEHQELLPTEGLALDIAMGLGGNADFLLQRGLRVIGVDISYIAVQQAKQYNPQLMVAVVDLEQFQIPTERFDLIIDFLYLQRGLWQPMVRGLRKGGLLFIECLTLDMENIHPEINPIYLLNPGELQTTFSVEFGSYLDILYYDEGWQPTTTSHPRAVASLIARRYME